MVAKKFDHDEAIRLYREGATVAGLADRFGVTDSAIRNVLHRRGVETRGTTRSFDYQEAATMYKAGVLVKDIATELGTTESSVRRAMRLQKVKADDRHRVAANARRRKLDETDHTIVALMRSEGRSWQDIADEMEVNKSTVYQAYQRWQLEQLKKGVRDAGQAPA